MATASQEMPAVSPKAVGRSPGGWRKPPAQVSARLDLSTLAGITLALAGLIVGLWKGWL